MKEHLNISQQKEYMHIALNSSDFKDQYKAIKYITDERLLFELANDKRIDWRVALDIIQKITNEERLAKIATNEKIDLEWDHRRAYALERIKDEHILKEIYTKLPGYFKKLTIHKITDMNFLLDIVKGGWLYPIDAMLLLNKKEALEKLKALNDSSVNFQLYFRKLDIQPKNI